MAREKSEDLSPLDILRQKMVEAQYVPKAGQTINMEMVNNPDKTEQFMDILNQAWEEGGKSCPAGHGKRITPPITLVNQVYNSVFHPDEDRDNDTEPIFNDHATKSGLDVSSIKNALKRLNYTGFELSLLRSKDKAIQHKYIKYYKEYV